MEPEKLRMYFDWFMDWDVSEPLRKPGRPMGLAICQHLCDLMGGEIFAESEVGKGTTMTVKLPAVTDTSKFLNYSDKNS